MVFMRAVGVVLLSWRNLLHKGGPNGNPRLVLSNRNWPERISGSCPPVRRKNRAGAKIVSLETGTRRLARILLSIRHGKILPLKMTRFEEKTSANPRGSEGGKEGSPWKIAIDKHP
jgi:hypothetical protein